MDDPLPMREMGSLQPKLHTFVARGEAEGLVEAVGVLALLVGGELDEAAALFAAEDYRPIHHLATDTFATQIAADANGFDLAAPLALAGESGDEGELETARDFATSFGDGENLVWVGSDGSESLGIGRIATLLTKLAEIVVHQ